MSTLSFLSPSLARDHAGLHPIARSSMERRQRDAGATFEERHGWLVPVSLPDEAEHLQKVGIVDLSHLGKIEVRTDDAPEWAGDPSWGVWYRISPRRVLLLGPCSETPERLAELAGDPACPLALDVTAALSILAIGGPERWTVVRRMTHLHHAPSSGEVAHVNAVHLLEVGETVWLVFPQEYGDYLWEVAVDRAEPLGGGPVGVDILMNREADT
jgi:glycine cleavage system aminomethyltransferase T